MSSINDDQDQNGRNSNASSSPFSSNVSIPEVPEVFLQETFNLSNLETFNDVLKTFYDINNANQATNEFGSSASRDRRVPKKLTKDFLCQLQQIFTDYLDVIEDKLSNRISKRSGDFFQVMSSVHSVLDELSLAIKSVTSLRQKCSSLNEGLILPNLKKINLSHQRDNTQALLEKLTEISELCKIQPKIQLLLSASDFVGALDLIAKSRVMLHRDLKRVVCLRHLESQLVEIERLAGTMIEREFECRIKESNFDKLLATEFNNLSKLVDNFSNGFSDIYEGDSLNLPSLLQTQRERFVTKFHDERKRKIELSLENETWKMVKNVPSDIQRLVTILVDENKSLIDLFLMEDQQQSNLESRKSQKHNENNIRDSQGSKTLSDLHDKDSTFIRAGGTTFVIIYSVIIMIQIIMDYSKCSHEIRPLSVDLMERLFQILQIYNSRIYNLVYSAGAVSANGKIKNITTRSLVLSQRSLKLIILLMPAIHSHFSKLLPGDPRLRRLDEIRFSYEDHAAKVPGRIISIVREVIDAHLREWEAKPPVPSLQFTEIGQHLMRLHENIQDALPANDLKMLFLQICLTFEEVLLNHLERLQIECDAGPKHLLVKQELALYRKSLSELSVFRGWDLNFDDLWSKLKSRTDFKKNDK